MCSAAASRSRRSSSMKAGFRSWTSISVNVVCCVPPENADPASMEPANSRLFLLSAESDSSLLAASSTVPTTSPSSCTVASPESTRISHCTVIVIASSNNAGRECSTPKLNSSLNATWSSSWIMTLTLTLTFESCWSVHAQSSKDDVCHAGPCQEQVITKLPTKPDRHFSCHFRT